MTDQITILGVGNILLRDEGVGVRVVEELKKRFIFPENVSLVDGGTQGLWLLATIQESDHLIVIDAVLGGGEPGSLYRLEKADLPKGLRFKQSAHDSDLVEALNLCALLENGPKSVVVIGMRTFGHNSIWSRIEQRDRISGREYSREGHKRSAQTWCHPTKNCL